jgi:glutamyl-tRNA synthetase
MIHNEQGRKLSKRDGALDVMEYKRQGFLPEALLNFLVRLGWSHGDQEIFSREEMLELFDPHEINKSASSYNLDKLLWLNGHYINNTTNERLAKLLEEFGVHVSDHDRREILLDAAKVRSKTLVELADQIRLILEPPAEYDPKAVKKAFKGEAFEILSDFAARLQETEGLHLPSDYHRVMEEFVAEKEIGFGKIGQPLRVALLGKMTGPGMDEVMAILGVEETVRRIEKALETLRD